MLRNNYNYVSVFKTKAKFIQRLTGAILDRKFQNEAKCRFT